MTLSADEFLRHFLLHVLPSGFTRIRHYGFLSHRNKAQRRQCQRLTRTIVRRDPLLATALTLLEQLTGRDESLCPACGIGHLQTIRASPSERQLHSAPGLPWSGEGEACAQQGPARNPPSQFRYRHDHNRPFSCGRQYRFPIAAAPGIHYSLCEALH